MANLKVSFSFLIVAAAFVGTSCRVSAAPLLKSEGPGESSPYVPTKMPARMLLASGNTAGGDVHAKKYKEALFAGGCFWGVEEHFRTEPGVISTAVGYCGGTAQNPTYEQVCTGKTGHAETVRVEYDPKRVSYGRLLTIFWRSIDPCSLNRQGPDHGTQYRSVIFYEDEGQKAEAIASKAKLQQSQNCKIVTEVAPSTGFWMAEDYHQQYLLKHDMGACH